ncbi:biotin--[acetyl-CoA-carboxylase] ligase [Archaeoglobus sp.]|uniref:biotin--[acetyl-CoA-carboxylase] ligase n=1 Tax=Archaeoglobus sp. TaxID=1872626 RepID=UPI0024AC22BE|nr:biotin--[acetyl-CoA-carboxylase] ligase [Archaeoglobus sp.]MDI3497099.1 BirA family transcriptional regulator [Archaeoglobus sp.]
MRISRESTDYRVYRILSENPLSGEKLAKKLGISRTAVWKAVQKLKECGVYVESNASGYTIAGEEELNPYEVARLAFESGFKEVHFYDVTDSTNSRAKEYGKPDALFFANRQTAGRGRHGRKWLSEEGGLYFSVTLSPPLDYSELPKLTLIAGLSVAEAIPQSEIKWPNDVLIKGRKVCGILSELHGEVERPLVIVGVGINVKNPVPENGISLSELYDVSRREVFEQVIRNFSKNYRMLLDGRWCELRRRIERRCSSVGKAVRVTTPSGVVEGIAEAISEDGSLVVSGKKIYAGDCIHLR